MHQFYKFEPGQCTCILGDPSAANPQQLNVRKMSGAEVVLDPTDALRERQAITASIRLTGGPSLALSGSVVTSTDCGVFIQWSHSGPKEAQSVDQVLREYIEHSGKKDAAPPHENTKGQSPRHAIAKASSAPGGRTKQDRFSKPVHRFRRGDGGARATPRTPSGPEHQNRPGQRAGGARNALGRLSPSR